MGHEYRNKITVKVFVIRYLDSVIQQIPENLVMTAAAPATEHLPKIFNERKTHYLPDDQVHNFHHTVKQLMFMSTRAQQDIYTSVELLTKRVQKPYKDDWVNLKCPLK